MILSATHFLQRYFASANVYRFSSKEIHLNSGMYYYGYRFYDPNFQRWINGIPIDELGFQLIRNNTAVELPSPNLYGFVYNDALNGADPFGLQTIPPRIPPTRSTGGGCSMSDVAKCNATCRRLGASGTCYVLTVPIPTWCGFFPVRVPICFCWTWKIPPPWTP